MKMVASSCFRLALFAIVVSGLVMLGCLAGVYIGRGPMSHSLAGEQNKWHPAPEFAPTDAILLSELLFAPKYQGMAFARALLSTGVRLFILRSDAGTQEQNSDFLRQTGFTSAETSRVSVVNVAHDTPWIRDYGPLPLLDANPSKAAVLRFADFNYRQAASLSDTVPYQLAMYLDASVEHIPLTLDGGNFLSDGEDCLLAGDFIDALAMKSADKYGAVMEHTRDMLRQGLGCRDMLVIENAPHEHIDMWFKLTDAHHGIISAVDPVTLKLLEETGDLAALGEMKAMRTQLEKAAQTLGARYSLLEVPQPVVHHNVLRTYTNAILVNGHALVPQYRTSHVAGFTYPDEKLSAYYEKAVRKAYEQSGFKVTFVDADALIADGGALHCASVALPGLASPLKK